MQLNKDQELITGINTVMSILKERPRSIDVLYIKDTNRNQRLEKLLCFAEEKRISIDKKEIKDKLISSFEKIFECEVKS